MFAYILTVCMVLGLCSCAAKENAPTWQEQYDLGVRYLSEGKYEEAIIAFTAAIEIDPNQANIYKDRGLVYMLLENSEEHLSAAQADFEMAIKLDYTITEAWIGLSDVYVAKGDYNRAREILQEAMDKVSSIQRILEQIDTLQELIEASIVDSLERQYGIASNEQFVSSMGPSDMRGFPDSIFGFISGEVVDLDHDGANELLVLRSVDGDEAVRLGADYSEPRIVAEVYQISNDQPTLSAVSFVGGLFYSEGSNIYLFYSEKLGQYFIIYDYGTWGSFTGINAYGAVAYIVTDDTISQYGNWEVSAINLWEDDNVEVELNSIGAPYAEYSTQIDNRSTTTYFKMLCQILHDGFGISEEEAIKYNNGRNLGHILQIVGNRS